MVRYESEELTELDHLNEYVMTSLRRVEGINLAYIEERFGTKHAERIAHAAKEWMEAGVVQREGERLAVRAERFLVSDAVIESFFA